MAFWTVFLAIYMAITLLALVLTFREQRSRGARTPFHAAAGYVLCTVWPAVVAVMVIFYRPSPQQG